MPRRIPFNNKFPPHQTGNICHATPFIQVNLYWQLHNLDIITAFINGDIDADIYMGVPEGMDVDPRRYGCATSCSQYAAARLGLLCLSDLAEMVSSFLPFVWMIYY